MPALEVLLKGVFEKERFLSLIRHFIVLEPDGVTVDKKIAAYHQFHAVNKAVECTVRAASPKGDRLVGVVWHTQGSGKSLTMAFSAGRIIRHPAMGNPPLVVLTDRNDLDEQLFGVLQAAGDLLRQTPVQAEDRRHLRELLRVASGGVISRRSRSSCLRKERHASLLSERRNIVVIADEVTAASVTYSTTSPGISATPSRTPRSSVSRERPSRPPTKAHAGLPICHPIHSYDSRGRDSKPIASRRSAASSRKDALPARGGGQLVHRRPEASDQLVYCRAGGLLQRNGWETFEGPAGWIHGDAHGFEGGDAEERLGVVGPENDATGGHLAHELDPDETELVLVQCPIGQLMGHPSDRLNAYTTEFVSWCQGIGGAGVDEEVRLVGGVGPRHGSQRHRDVNESHRPIQA